MIFYNNNVLTRELEKRGDFIAKRLKLISRELNRIDFSLAIWRRNTNKGKRITVCIVDDYCSPRNSDDIGVIIASPLFAEVGKTEKCKAYKYFLSFIPFDEKAHITVRGEDEEGNEYPVIWRDSQHYAITEYGIEKCEIKEYKKIEFTERD